MVDKERAGLALRFGKGTISEDSPPLLEEDLQPLSCKIVLSYRLGLNLINLGHCTRTICFHGVFRQACTVPTKAVRTKYARVFVNLMCQGLVGNSDGMDDCCDAPLF